MEIWRWMRCDKMGLAVFTNWASAFTFEYRHGQVVHQNCMTNWYTNRVLTNKQKQADKRKRKHKRKHLTTHYFLPYALLTSSWCRLRIFLRCNFWAAVI